MFKIIFILLLNVVYCDYYIYDKTDQNLISNAIKIGEGAKIKYFQDTLGITDDRTRHDLYLNGLETCDRIGNEQANRIAARAMSVADKSLTADLRKLGLRHFQAQFTTLPPSLMKEVVHMACSKHEQQLQCGATFEGEAEIQKRIDDLKSIGNHLLMFNHECKNINFSTTIYPCVAKSVRIIKQKCGDLMDTYFNYREEANQKISNIYETSLNSVKKIKAAESNNQNILNQFIFNNAMRNIVQIEGKKCNLFKKMRLCTLPMIEDICGRTAAHVMFIGTSVGYLRIERKERLNLDFDVFNIPSHPDCNGL